MSRIDTPNPKAKRLLIEGWARGFSALGGLADWRAGWPSAVSPPAMLRKNRS